jgi:Arc/MetJ-type ribon-helix-helix transcriptional regulator
VLLFTRNKNAILKGEFYPEGKGSAPVPFSHFLLTVTANYIIISWYDILSYWRFLMSSAKIAITLDSYLVKRVDHMIKERIFPNRSKAIQDALKEKIERMDKRRLERECAKLDPEYEQKFADEGLHSEMMTWPEY